MRLPSTTLPEYEPMASIIPEGESGNVRVEHFVVDKKLAESSRLRFMVTHDMNLVARYATRTIVMGLGKVLLDGPTSEVFTHVDELEKTYIQPPQVTQVALALKDLGMPSEIITLEEMVAALKGRFGLEV